jgi:chromatin assembly factor 1 subunit A
MHVAMDGSSEIVMEEFSSSSLSGADLVSGGAPALGIEFLQEEIQALVKVFNEEESFQGIVRFRKDRGAPAIVQRKEIATYLEGSRLPFSALVKDIYQKLSNQNDQDQSKSAAVTMASVKSSVLSIGERLSFGITNPDADVLEDDTIQSLWCWEVRDVKLFSKVFRDEILGRRCWRKKIGARIGALSSTIDALRLDGSESEQVTSLIAAAREALSKTDDESAIRFARAMRQQTKEAVISAPAHLDTLQKMPLSDYPTNCADQEGLGKKRKRILDPEEKDRFRQELLLKREQAKHEKERKRKNKEETERKKQQQKLQDDAEKVQKRKDKEEWERRKQEKRLQDEAGRDQKREAERKKQLALTKQASFMDRFLVKKDPQQAKDHMGCEEGQASAQSEAQDASFSSPVTTGSEERESVSPILQAAQRTAEVVARMDLELNNGCDL